MKTRLIGGLAASALLAGALACQGAATAADPAGYPQTLSFTAKHLVATDTAVFAAGVSDDYTTAYVGKAGSEPITLATADGAQVFSVDIAQSATGLLAVVSTDLGTQLFHINTSDMTSQLLETPAGWSSIDALGSDANDAFMVFRSPDQQVILDAAGVGNPVLDGYGSASTATATGATGARDWYVGGTHWSGPEGSTSEATLWSYDEASHTAGTPVVLGPAGDPDESVLDVVADPATDTVYATSFQNQADGPQTYGISVIHDGVATYHPLANPAGNLALSADGETLYLVEASGIYALDADNIVDEADAADDTRSTWIEANSINDLVTDPAGHLFAAADQSVVAFSAPGAPTGLDLAVDADFPEYGNLTWSAPAATGGGSADNLAYDVTVTDKAGGEPQTTHYYGTEMGLDLVAGHSYDITVTADNGLFRGAPATVSYTSKPAMSHPSSVAISGAPKVGSRLSVANVGGWAKGTTLSYRWMTDDRIVSTSSTLTLTPGMLGEQVMVAVTGKLAGFSDHTEWSAPSTKVARGALAGAKPSVAGTAKVGKTLTAKAGSWTAGTQLSYSWAASGKKIAGATRSTLKLTRAQAGKTITVTVTGTKAGYAPLSKASAATRKVGR